MKNLSRAHGPSGSGTSIHFNAGEHEKKTVQCIQQIAKLGTLNIIKHHSTMINRRMDILGMGFPKFETIPVERIPWNASLGAELWDLCLHSTHHLETSARFPPIITMAKRC